MRAAVKTRQRKKIPQRKRRRGCGLIGVELASLPVVKPEVIVEAQPVLVLRDTNSLSDKGVSVAAVEDIDKDIYKFENKSLLAEFKENQSFREAVMSGAYFYHQGRICLYHPDVFVGSEEGIKIADIVNKNPVDYLLSHYTRRNAVNRTTMQRRRHANYRMSKMAGKWSKEDKNGNRSLYDVKISHAKKYSRKDYREGDKYSEAFLCSIELVQGFIDGGQGNGPSDTFGEFLTNLMTERKLTIKQLADKTDIPERTITRMRSEEGYKPSIEYLLACCMVMRLPPWDSDKLFELAGIVLRPNNKKERCYIALLHVFFKEGSIRVCDEVLTMMGMPTLSSIIKANKKNK